MLLRFVAIQPDGSIEVVNRQDWLHAGFPVTCVTFSEVSLSVGLFPVNAIFLTPAVPPSFQDGEWLAVASYDHTLAIWSTSQLCPREDTEEEENAEDEDIVLPWSTKLPSSAERVGGLAFAPPTSQVSQSGSQFAS